MDLSRREFLRGLGAGVALAAVPAGFVRLASGLVVPEEEALEREAHRRIWAVCTSMGIDGETVEGGRLQVTRADGGQFGYQWRQVDPLPQAVAQQAERLRGDAQIRDLYLATYTAMYGFIGDVALAGTMKTPAG